MNFNKLRDKIYENAVKHGMWDGECNIAECLVQIHSEVSKAREADRNGRYFNKANLLQNELDSKDNNIFVKAFVQAIKETFEDELAGVVIGCLDLCGHLGIDVDDKVKNDTEIFSKEPTFLKGIMGKNTASSLCFIHLLISDTYRAYMINDMTSNLIGVITATIMFAKFHDINIEKHIELKMRYNEINRSWQ